MPSTYKVYRAFIASPSDVGAERQLAEETITRINRVARDTLGVAIDTRKWEQFTPVAPNFAEERLQDTLNREVEKANFFVLILYKRYGTVEPGHTISNTEREINTILQVHERNPRLRILAYFRDIDDNRDPGDQEQKVRGLRDRLAQMGLPYRTYRDVSEFNQYLAHDLYDVLLRMLLSPYKKQALQHFWRFGDTERPHDPQVAIIYPPTERPVMKDSESPSFWLNRLTTQMGFEDYKAIHKIEKAFQLLGLHSYRLHPHNSTPPEMPWINRVWLCVPRNKPAVKALKEQKGLRFSLPTASSQAPAITWHSHTGEKLQVRSPMAKYLVNQRKSMDLSGDWHAQLGRIITKDYAVLARMQRSTSGEGEPLKDYFLLASAGLVHGVLRGLSIGIISTWLSSMATRISSCFLK